MGEPFFERHGPKAVFFGRFVLGLRTWASWLAGANHMRWRTFFLWNALGGIAWATAVGLLAYFLGRSVGSLIAKFGLYGLAGVLLVAVGVFVWHRRRRRRHTAGDSAPRDPPRQAGGQPVEDPPLEDGAAEPAPRPTETTGS